MIFNQLVDIHLSGDFKFQDAKKHAKETGIDQIEVDEAICTVLEKLAKGAEIKPEAFNEFSKKVKALSGDLKNAVVHMVFKIAFNSYRAHSEEVEEAVELIESSLNTSCPIPQGTPNPEKYMGLINLYHLLSQHSFIQTAGEFGNFYPGVNPYMRDQLASQLPFAINALTLTGRLPKANYNGVNTASPLYPLSLQVIKEGTVPIKRGVKASQAYFPYKLVSKIVKGDTGNHTFLATNGSKALFMRGVEHYTPESIFSSKIATLVSSKHFASERLMDNQIVASRRLKAYACSAADRKVQNQIEQSIEQDKKVFPGTGLIDEVTNYVVESDANIENLGFSSTQIQKAYLSKIDFDRVCIGLPMSEEAYERDIISKSGMGLYQGVGHVQHDPGYIREKLYARLKLSLLTEPLLNGLADKSFMEKDQKIKETTVKTCTQRSDVALNLFLKHKKVEQFIGANPQILKQCYTEMVTYIKKHFDKNDQQQLINSLQNRVAFIHETLSKRFRVDEMPDVSETLSLKEDITYEPIGEETKKRLQGTHYEHQTYSSKKGRFHLLEVQGKHFKQLPPHLRSLNGDYLISQILMELKKEVALLASEPQLDDYVVNLKKNDPRFKVLEAGQGIATRLRLFGLKTSSAIAFNQMVEEQRAIIKENKPSADMNTIK